MEKVQEISPDADVTKENAKESNKNNEVSNEKKYRKRKRKYFNAIRTQMEFYFGDANLTKDRYLKQLIDKDPYVPLEIFLTFNKIKTLTSNVDDIGKSLSNSQLLELNSDQTKVRRKIALPEDRCVDDKTLYVEAIPYTADHDWVRAVFERFGEVAYVSLPKYRNSKKIKEFGFIEYEHESSIEKALKAFHEFDGVLNVQQTDPAELTSVKSFIKEQKNDTKADDKGKNLKRSHSSSVVNAEQPDSKRIKSEDNLNEFESEASLSTASTGDEEDIESDANPSQPIKRKRRTKSGKAKKLKQKTDLNMNSDAAYLSLKILTKRDWKRLRNKYLNLQREKIAELKRQSWKNKQEIGEQISKDSLLEFKDGATNIPAQPIAKSKTIEHNLRRINMNFYGAGDDENSIKNNHKDPKRNVALERLPLFNFEPGLIVEISFAEPCLNIKEFKADMSQYQSVKYVDVKEGATYAHLRLESANAAQEFVRQVNSAEQKCKILAGDEESEYWKKIEKDREMKLNKQIKVTQKRGRDKIKKLLNNHIRFGDDE